VQLRLELVDDHAAPPDQIGTVVQENPQFAHVLVDSVSACGGRRSASPEPSPLLPQL